MLTQNIQVLGERNPKDKLNNINLTRSVRLNDLTQEEMAKLYKRGQTNVSTGSLNQGFKFDYLFDGNAYQVSLDVVAITFDSATQAVVFDCGYSTVYNRYFRVLLTNTDGVYSWSQRITAPTWVDESDLKTINGESLVGTGDIEIAAGVESVNGETGAVKIKSVNGQSLMGEGDVPVDVGVETLNGQKGALTLKTVNGADMLGEGNIEIAAGVESLNGQKGALTLKTVNGNELIGTGDIEIKGGGDATPTGTTLYFTTTDGQTLNANIEAKNKAGTVIEPSLKTPTAWYYDEIVETMGFPAKTTNCNLYSLNGVNVPVRLANAHMEYIMENCVYADLRKFFTDGLTSFIEMFSDSKNLKWVDVSNFNTSRVTDMSRMFENCKVLTSLDLNNWDTSKVTSMNNMFALCYKLATFKLSNWDTSNVTVMSYMFYGCYVLTSLDLSNWNTSKVTDMSNMFYLCYALTSLDLSNWDLTNVTNMSYMFNGTALKTITMKNCSTETVDKIKSALTSAGILDRVQIITA